jgi:prepilin-type N-terminal cleavage/methylation domain-containing protein/prepilin-type processing-associated H-X9-DG protein
MTKEITRRKTRGFTLIELLVVVTIILILAAIVMPSYRTVQENSKTMKCASNLRQIGAAMILFSQDHSDCFPESGGEITWTTGTTGPYSWMQQIAPYIGNAPDPATQAQGASVFTCPSSSYALSFDKYYSYFNGAHAAYVAAGGFAPVRRDLISMPAEQILSGDITDWPEAQMDADKDDYTQNPIDVKSPFHNGVVNLLYADGHVAEAKWLTSGSSQGYYDPTTMSNHYQGTPGLQY